MGNLTVMEVKFTEDVDLEGLRKWAAVNIRGGDGLIFEQGRLFFVFPEVGNKELEYAVNRLTPGADEFGATLHVYAQGEDQVADSVYRRAEAKILPVESRRNT